MKPKRLYITLILIGFGFYSQCQEKKPESLFNRPTFSANYYASANQYLLVTKYRNMNNYKDNKSKIVSKGDFKILHIIGVGFFAKTKKDHRITRFDISYMPKQIIEYNKTRGDTEVLNIDSTINNTSINPFMIDIEAINMSMNFLYKLNPRNKSVFFYLGYGFCFSFINTYNRKYNHFGIIIFPTGGLTVRLGNRLSIFTEYHYLYGITTGFHEQYVHTSASWHFYPRGSELEFGLNFHFKNKH